MAHTDSRIPNEDAHFNTYLNSTATYLGQSPAPPTAAAAAAPALNWSRLGLLETEYNQWLSYRTAWNTIYATYTTNTERGIRDKTITEEKNTAKENFTKWAIMPSLNKLNRIGASPNCTDLDRNVFHIKLRDDERTTRTTPLSEQVFFNLNGMGQGEMKGTFRTEHDGTRSSIADDASGVELKYKLGEPAPNNVDECPQSISFTKAISIFNVGAPNAGKKMYAYARWIVATNPSLNGPWSDMVVAIVT